MEVESMHQVQAYRVVSAVRKWCELWDISASNYNGDC